MKTLALILFCTSVASQAAAQGLCDQQQSAQEVQRQTANGTVVSVGVFSPNVTVVVKERNWNRGDAAAREFLARHIDCATFGPNIECSASSTSAPIETTISLRCTL